MEQLVKFNFGAELVATLPSTKGFAIRLAGSSDKAEDLMQETACKAWKHREHFQPGTNLKAWLCMIMRNIRYSEGRREWRLKFFGAMASEDDETGERILDTLTPSAPNQHELLELKEVFDALQYVPARYRIPFEKVAFEGASVEDIAQELGIQVGTVKSSVSRARAILFTFFQVKNSRQVGNADTQLEAVE